MKTSLVRPLAAIGLMLAAPALAHPGHGESSGFVGGLLHPLTGVDHLVAMLMCGLWAGLAYPRQRWVVPLTFLIFLALGFGYGFAGGSYAGAEIVILASIVLFGAALMFGIRPRLPAALPVIALFATGHGFAHGAEVTPNGSAIAFFIGLCCTAIGLHLAGLGLAAAWRRWRRPSDRSAASSSRI